MYLLCLKISLTCLLTTTYSSHNVKSYLIIANPFAGNGKCGKYLDDIKEYLTTMENRFLLKTTDYSGHATKIAELYADNYDVIISIGGDGTLNEIINGLAPYKEKEIGLLPLGSGNDFFLNLSKLKFSKAVFQDIVKSDKFINGVDVGIVEYKERGSEEIKRRKFINALGVGFDALVAHHNQQGKIFQGIGSYFTAIIKSLISYKSLNIYGTLDKKDFAGNYLMLTVGNGKSSGGGFKLNPNAVINDGYLDLTKVDYLNRKRIFSALPLAVKGEIDRVREAEMYKFKSAEFNLKNPYYLHTDGEVLSRSVDWLKIKVEKTKFNFISI